MRPARIAIGLLLSLGVVALAAAWFANASLTRRYPAPGRIISIGTRRLHLYCTGEGKTTIILESGIGSGWETWGSVVPALAGSHQVCVYDRAGYGWSDPAPGGELASAAHAAADLHSLLVAAPVHAPWLLVAHSFGAYIARIYADRFGGELAGLLLVDPSSEDEPHLHSIYRTVHNLIPPSDFQAFVPFFEGERALPSRLKGAPEVFRERFFTGFSRNEAVASRRELSALDASEAEARNAHLPPALPVIVISATHVITTDRSGQPEMPNPPDHARFQASLIRASAQGRQIVVKSGHMVQQEWPNVIVNCVHQLLGES